MRVFNTETVSQSLTWTRSTIPIPILQEGSGPCRLLRALRNVINVSRCVSADDVVVFTDDNPVSGNLFGLLQRFPHARPTMIRTDPLLHAPRTPVRRKYLQAALAHVDCIIVWAPAVIERYHRGLQIPREKMVSLRFHHTLIGHPISDVTCGDYVFSGGDSMRDYPTLIEAVRGLTIPVRIATHWRPPSTLAVPDNVVIKPTGDSEFRELLVGSRFVVVPLRMDDLRTSGQQSYLNAMALGKAVIVTDTLDAPFYIENKRTGMLAPSGDARALRQAILHLLDSPEVIGSMGVAAQAAATPIDQEYTWSNVLSIAMDVHQRRRSRSNRARIDGEPARSLTPGPSPRGRGAGGEGRRP